MREYFIRDLMVPLAEYATVSETATLYEAVLALEKAQEEFDHRRYRPPFTTLSKRTARFPDSACPVSGPSYSDS